MVNKFVVQYRVQPGAEFNPAHLVTACVSPNFNPGFLHQVVSRTWVATQPVGVGVERINVTRHQFSKRVSTLTDYI
jgi:hypothetical protein